MVGVEDPWSMAFRHHTEEVLQAGLGVQVPGRVPEARGEVWRADHELGPDYPRCHHREQGHHASGGQGASASQEAWQARPSSTGSIDEQILGASCRRRTARRRRRCSRIASSDEAQGSTGEGEPGHEKFPSHEEGIEEGHEEDHEGDEGQDGQAKAGGGSKDSTTAGGQRAASQPSMRAAQPTPSSRTATKREARAIRRAGVGTHHDPEVLNDLSSRLIFELFSGSVRFAKACSKIGFS